MTDDSCTLQFIEIVPLTRDTDDPCTTECDSGDWSDDVKQEYLPVVKQEPHDVCDVFFNCLLLRPLAGAKYCNQFVCLAVKYHTGHPKYHTGRPKYHTGQSRSSILPVWLMEQPSFLHFSTVHQVAAQLRAKCAIYDCLVIFCKLYIIAK